MRFLILLLASCVSLAAVAHCSISRPDNSKDNKESKKSAQQNTSPGKIFNAKVLNVIDGDTIEVLNFDNNRTNFFKIKLYGIDAPEKDQFGGISAYQNLIGILISDDYEKTSEFTQKSSKEYAPYSEIEIHIIEKDAQGFSIAKIFKEGAYINKVMLERGQAWLDPKEGMKDEELRKSSEKGEEKKVSFCPPWEYKKMSPEERFHINNKYMVVKFKNGIKISCIEPYILNFIKGDISSNLLLDGAFEIMDEEHPYHYPYFDEIVLKTGELINSFKKLSEESNSSVDYVVFSSIENSNTHYGDIELTSIYNGEKINSYIFQWLANEGYMDPFLIEKMCANITGDGLVRSYISKSKGKGINAKRVPVTPYVWHNMTREMKRYIIKEIFKLTQEEKRP